MVRGELFAGSTAAEWQGEPFARLALVCEAGELTVREAQALNCYVRGLSLRHTGQLLGVKDYKKTVWRHLRRAVEKLVAGSPEPEVKKTPSGGSRQWLWELLDCMRTTDCKPRPQMYDERGMPITLRSRLITPDDLTRRAPDWLDDLYYSLRSDLDQGEGGWNEDDASGEADISSIQKSAPVVPVLKARQNTQVSVVAKAA